MASISDRVGDLGGYLREQREHARLSVRQLATLAGVSNPYLSQVERGLRNPSAEVLAQIARGLRISAEALYVRAGILEREDAPEVEAAIGADPHLNDRQRRVLLDIYASFRAENGRAGAGGEIEPVVVRRRPAGTTAAARADLGAAGVAGPAEQVAQPPAEAPAKRATGTRTTVNRSVRRTGAAGVTAGGAAAADPAGKPADTAAAKGAVPRKSSSRAASARPASKRPTTTD